MYTRMKASQCKPDAITYKLLHKAYKSSNNWLDAERVFLDAQKAGVSFDRS